MSDTTAADTAAALRAIGQKWWLIATFGVITLGFGIVLTFKPGKSVHAIAVILGIWLLILGVVRLIEAIGATGERAGLFIVGLLAIVVAILLLHHTTTTVAVVGFIVGIFWTIGGIAQLMQGFSANDGNVSWLVVALGVISTERRHPLPRVSVPLVVDHLCDHGNRDDHLRHSRDTPERAGPQAQGGLTCVRRRRVRSRASR